MATDNFTNVAKDILDVWEDERDKLQALAYTIERELAPADPEKPEDNPNFTALKLAQILYEMLSDASIINSLRKSI